MAEVLTVATAPATLGSVTGVVAPVERGPIATARCCARRSTAGSPETRQSPRSGSVRWLRRCGRRPSRCRTSCPNWIAWRVVSGPSVAVG